MASVCAFTVSETRGSGVGSAVLLIDSAGVGRIGKLMSDADSDVTEWPSTST